MNPKRELDKSIRAQAADWLARQQSGAMSAAESDALEQWLQANPLHRQAFAQCQQLALMTDFLKEDPELNAGLPEIRKAVRRRAQSLRAPYQWRWLGAIAATILVLVAGVIARDNYAIDYYQTEIGGQRVVHLEDGSTLMLNTNTRVGVRYQRKQRSLFLERGEAFFMVAKNPERPFVVAVRGSEVRALGTAFNVALQADRVQVGVTQGIVEVRAEDATGETQQLAKMLPGEGVRYTATNPRDSSGVVPVNLDQVTAWQTHRIYFDNERLEDAIAEYNRYTTRKMVLVGDALTNQRISGVFNIGDADGLAFALEQGFGARINKTDQRILVLEPRQ
ncbi:FecR domain-containing protein [Microbulbifer sp. ALW1]|uniref:FecR family protein n=1 Tax=Microbulbifer sp. (strain ALW1) TaxID=1516059 RepID=UPI00135AC079|nr:FecR domain-containing protein [Microbulbifer sp. ALW1]